MLLVQPLTFLRSGSWISIRWGPSPPPSITSSPSLPSLINRFNQLHGLIKWLMNYIRHVCSFSSMWLNCVIYKLDASAQSHLCNIWLQETSKEALHVAALNNKYSNVPNRSQIEVSPCGSSSAAIVFTLQLLFTAPLHCTNALAWVGWIQSTSTHGHTLSSLHKAWLSV